MIPLYLILQEAWSKLNDQEYLLMQVLGLVIFVLFVIAWIKDHYRKKRVTYIHNIKKQKIREENYFNELSEHFDEDLEEEEEEE